MGKNNKENQIAELKLTDRQFLILYEIVFAFMHSDAGYKKVSYLNSAGDIISASQDDLNKINKTLSRVSSFLTAHI